MQLPDALRQGIEERAEGLGLTALSRTAVRLSAAYRIGEPAKIESEADRIAYLVSRMPATYAATRAVLAEIRGRVSDLRFESVLDVGAGPGTAAWAAADVFTEMRELTLLEQDRGWIELGKSLAARSGHAALRNATWQVADVRQPRSIPPSDLVIASYVVGELGDRHLRAFAEMWWSASPPVLVVIEPGTPRGFARILKLRDMLLRNGWHMIAPCPHERECPMARLDAERDWCHFAQRVERTSLHRRLKNAKLGFEDEKYSYVAVSREASALPDARIVGRPRPHPGQVELTLCTADEGLREERVTRKEKDAFRAARKAVWGGVWKRGNSNQQA